MGMMTQILESERKKISAPADQPKPVASHAEPQACPTCGCPDLWESIYLDGVLRCDICEPAPTPAIVGRRVGLAAENLELAEPQPLADELPHGLDPADRFVEIVTADGRTGMALRGWDNPSSANYNQRMCMYASIGVAESERLIDEMQAEWRAEMGLPTSPLTGPSQTLHARSEATIDAVFRASYAK